MGQQEICNLLRKKPRLTTREIADYLNCRIQSISELISTMIHNKEIGYDYPSEEELNKILKKYPKCIHGKWQIRVFYLTEWMKE